MQILISSTVLCPSDKKPGYDEPYFSTYDTCPSTHVGSCLTYSKEKLCTRYTSDFNYYAVCRGFLSAYASEAGLPGGLLHSIPDEISHRDKIHRLVEECVKPSKPDGRMEAKDELLQILRNLARQLI